MAVPTDQDLLDAFKACLLAVSTGQSYEINGRRMSRANLPEVMNTITWLEKRIAAAADQTGGVYLASFETTS